MSNTKITTLQPMQAETIALFNRIPYKAIITLEFRKKGIASPAQCISQPKTKGVIIERVLKLTVDESGKRHPLVAFYLFKGWE